MNTLTTLALSLTLALPGLGASTPEPSQAPSCITCWGMEQAPSDELSSR